MEDKKILAALALAMIRHPRANLNDLAKSIGISKATLYRGFRTRTELVARLMEHSVNTLRNAALSAGLESAPPLEALRYLIDSNLEHGELALFLVNYWKEADLDDATVAVCDATFDAFFLRGQHEGFFRIDISAAALTEVFLSILNGAIYAAYRGRIAKMEIAKVIETTFLAGAAIQKQAESA